MSLRLPQILFVCPEGHCQNKSYGPVRATQSPRLLASTWHITAVKPNKQSIDSKHTPWAALSPHRTRKRPALWFSSRTETVSVKTPQSQFKFCSHSMQTQKTTTRFSPSSQFWIFRSNQFFEKALRISHKHIYEPQHPVQIDQPQLKAFKRSQLRCCTRRKASSSSHIVQDPTNIAG